MKKGRKLITNSGYIRDIGFSDKKKLIFKIWNSRKTHLLHTEKKTFKWVVERYKYNQIALCYEENGVTTLIAEI